MKEEIEQENKKREWWEIPARCAVLCIIIPLIIPTHWYRTVYLNTIGRFFLHTVESRVNDIEKDVRKRLSLKEIPEELRILVLKKEKQIELWGKDSAGNWSKLEYYPILGIPDVSGPKTKKDDRKTPEGIYKIAALDPNSKHYLSIKLDFPSEEDIEIAKKEGRDPSAMNVDYMLHGVGFSNQNIFVTDKTMEEIFYLAAKVGLENTRVLIPPHDFRKNDMPVIVDGPWVRERYKKLKDEMELLNEKKETPENAEAGKN